MATRPVRTCVGCRKRAARNDLLRVVAVDVGDGPEVAPDPRRRTPGRGAHLHPDPGCLATAVRRRAFARALRAPVRVDEERLEAYVLAATEIDRQKMEQQLMSTR